MPAASSKKLRFAIVAIVMAAGVLAYANALSNGATNFDDLWQVTANPLLGAPLSLEKLARILFHQYHGEYQPAKLLSYLADRLLYGALGVDFVFGLHLTNVLLHLANAILVAFFAAAVACDLGSDDLRLHGLPFVAVFAGVYFVLHPIHVESVAWLSSRKDVLSFFFMMLSFHAFRGATLGRTRFSGLIALGLFLLALASKATVISFPVIALAYWALVSWRGGLRIALLLLALFAASCVFLPLGVAIISASGYRAGPTGGSYWLHFLTAVRTFPFYMRQMLFPVRLCAIYPVVPARGLLDPAVWWAAALIVAQIAVVFYVRVRMVRFIVLWYLLSLLPVLQFVPMPVPSFAADRYAYIPSVAFALAPAVILWQVRSALLRRRSIAVASVLVAAGVLYAGVLGVAVWSRNRVWRSSQTLWRDVIEKNPSHPFALLNLGQVYFEAGDYPGSIRYFEAAANTGEGFLLAYFNLGLALERSGDFLKAREYYLKALMRPTSLTMRPTRETRARAALGVARIFFHERKYLTARAYISDALVLFPESKDPLAVDSLLDLKDAPAFFVRADRAVGDSKALADGLIATADAIADSSPSHAVDLYRKAVDAAPEYPVPYVSLARIHVRTGQFEKACSYFALAFAAGKTDAEFEYEYGVACLQARDFDVAAERLSRALAADPSMEKAKVKLAIARAFLGQPAQALLMLRQVLDADPDNREAADHYRAIKSLIDRAGQESQNARK